MANYDLRNAFQELSILNEAEDFNLSDDEQIQKMEDFLKGDELDEVQMVIDVDAEGMDDLEPSYEGKIILQCPICHSLIYKAEEDLVSDEESDYVNVEEACPYCKEEGGFLVVGKVAPYPTHEEEKVEEPAEEPIEGESEEVKTETSEEEEEVAESLTERFEEYKVVDKTGKEIKEGDEIVDFRGDKSIFRGITKVPGGASTGKIATQNPGSDWSQEYYPQVFNLKIVKRVEESLKEALTLDETSKVMEIVDKHLTDACAEIAQYDIDYTRSDIMRACNMCLDSLFFGSMAESLTEGDETAMHELKEEVVDDMVGKLESIDDNYAYEIASKFPEYDVEWCNDEGDWNYNPFAKAVEDQKMQLARAIANALFANAPQELPEGLAEETCPECGKNPCECKECADTKLTEASEVIDQKGFATLIKYSDPVLANASHGVLNDGNFCYKFWAKDDDEAKRIFAERGTECEECYEDLDTESLDKLITEKLGKTYVTESGYVDGNKITVEGKLGQEKVSYVFEAKRGDNKVALIGEEFALKGRLENKNIICEDIADSFNEIADGLQEVAGQVRQAADNVEFEAEQVRAGAEEIEGNQAAKRASFQKARQAYLAKHPEGLAERFEGKGSYGNPNFDEEKYGKYFEVNEKGEYKLIPEKADEYFHLLSKLWREADEKNDKLDEKLPVDLANAYRRSNYNSYQDLYNANASGDYQAHTRGQEYRFKVRDLDNLTPSEVGPYIDYEKADYTLITPEEAKKLPKSRYKDLRMVTSNGDLVVLFGNKVNSKIYQGYFPLPDAPELFTDSRIKSIYLTNEKSPEARLSADQVAKRKYSSEPSERQFGQHGGVLHSVAEWDEKWLKYAQEDIVRYEDTLQKLDQAWEAGDIARNDYENQKVAAQKNLDYARKSEAEHAAAVAKHKNRIQDAKVAARYAASREFLQSLHKEYEALVEQRRWIERSVNDAKEQLEKAQKGEASYSWYHKDVASKKKDLAEARKKLAELQKLIAKLEKETSEEAVSAELVELQNNLEGEQTKLRNVNDQIKALFNRKTEGLEEAAKMSEIKGTVGRIIKDKIFPRMNEIDNKEDLIKAAEEELAGVSDKAKDYAQEVLANLKKKNFSQAAVYLGNVMLAGEGLRSPDAKKEGLEEKFLTEKQ